MIRRKTWVAAAVGATVAAILWQPLLLAKPGVVTTTDGTKYIGDVSESATDVTVKDDAGSSIVINKAAVKSTSTFADPQEEFTARMDQLAPNDAKGRVRVAKWAIKNDQPDLAKQALDAAMKIEPNNVEAKTLRSTLEAPAPVAPKDDPKTKPAAANDGVNGMRRGIRGKTRLVTADEINRIRQVEWQPHEENVRVTVDRETKATFLARSRDLTPQQFNRMTPAQQAREILKSGTPKLRDGVRIMTDPASIAGYRRNVQKGVLQGCAAAGCHGADSTTSFVLHTEPSDEATYTNFLVLQNYRTKVDKVERLMVDRDQPADSLLSEFMLAPKVANTPHPEVEGYNGVFKNVNDPRFKLVAQWLNAMPTISPSYGVDLTKPPEEAEPADGTEAADAEPAGADAPKAGARPGAGR